MNMIVAVDNNWAIGNHNELLVSIPADMKFFRQETDGKVVVMGRKTLESFPNGMPLVNRVNIVLTENPDYQVKGAKIVHSLAELQEELKQYRSEDVYVIGGESVYRCFLTVMWFMPHGLIWNIRQTRTSRIWRKIRSG